MRPHVQLMCQNEDCCFRELALWESISVTTVGLVQNRYHFLKNNLLLTMIYRWKVVHMVLNFNHSLTHIYVQKIIWQILMNIKDKALERHTSFTISSLKDRGKGVYYIPLWYFIYNQFFKRPWKRCVLYTLVILHLQSVL